MLQTPLCLPTCPAFVEQFVTPPFIPIPGRNDHPLTAPQHRFLPQIFAAAIVKSFNDYDRSFAE
jgi:hypothetical protein